MTEPIEYSEISREFIARRAYDLWEQTGRPLGSPEVDWNQAVRELRDKSYRFERDASVLPFAAFSMEPLET
jgi:hypothetical protein